MCLLSYWLINTTCSRLSTSDFIVYLSLFSFSQCLNVTNDLTICLYMNRQLFTYIFGLYWQLHDRNCFFWICFLSSFKTFQVSYKPDNWSIFLRLVGFIVFNVTFNNISVISWRSVLLVEETGVPGENHWPAACH